MTDSPPNPGEESPLLAHKTPTRKPEADGKGSAAATLKLLCESGAGLIADGYDLSVINLVLAILAHLHPETLTPSAKGVIVSVTIVGVILGQLGFGSFADIVGRKVASLTTAVLTIFGAVLSACVVDTGGFFGFTAQLCLCRFMLGLGIGGEYPLSAAIAKEVKEGSLLLTRAQLLCLNTMLFNIGGLLQSGFVSVLLAAHVPLDLVWRLALAAGMVPSAAAFMTRWYMHEPEREEQESHAGSSRGMRYLHNLAETVGPRWSILLGACLSWCLFNFVAFGQGSFSSIICDRLLGDAEDTTIGTVVRDANFAIISSVFAILGTVVCVCIEGLMSRWLLQLSAFTICALLNFLCAGLLDPTHATGQWPVALLYFLTNATMSALGVTTYLVPSENFPPVSRATCVGLAAASGKVGAAIGTALFPLAEGALGLKVVLLVCGSVLVLGTLETSFLTPRATTNPEDASSSKTA